jgi:hypothetical protein
MTLRFSTESQLASFSLLTMLKSKHLHLLKFTKQEKRQNGYYLQYCIPLLRLANEQHDFYS